MNETESASNMLISRFRADAREYGMAMSVPKPTPNPILPKTTPMMPTATGTAMAESVAAVCSSGTGIPRLTTSSVRIPNWTRPKPVAAMPMAEVLAAPEPFGAMPAGH